MVTVICTGYLHLAELVPIYFVQQRFIGIGQLIALIRFGLGDFDLISVTDITAELS